MHAHWGSCAGMPNTARASARTYGPYTQVSNPALRAACFWLSVTALLNHRGQITAAGRPDVWTWPLPEVRAELYDAVHTVEQDALRPGWKWRAGKRRWEYRS